MPANSIAIHDNRQAFLDLAKAGIAVFPFWLAPNPKPGKHPIKKPYINDWQNRATTNLATIDRWTRQWPNAMPGIPMGPRTRLAVLDIDQKNGKDGFAALRALGFDPDTLSPVMVQTPSGGLHAYFRWPEGMGNSDHGLPPGVDVRGEGGYVAAPGATHEGGTYRLVSGSLTDDMQPWPEALMPRLKAKDTGQGDPTGLPFHIIKAALMALPNDGDAFASRDAWLRIGMALHAESDGSEEGLEAFQEWSGQWPGYDAGATETAWESFRAGGGLIGWTIIYEAESYGWRDPVVTHLLWLSDYDGLPTAEEEAEIDWLAGKPGAVNPNAPAPPSRGFTFLTPAECALLPARPYVIKGLLAQGDVAAIVGAPGAGKSLLAPRLGYAVAQGGEVFGRRTRKGGVLYVAAEDGHGMRGRLSALHQDHGKVEGFHLVIGVSDLLSKGGDLATLKAEVKARRPALVIIDTLAVAFPGLEENTAEGMGKVIAAARGLTTWGAAVVLIHHDTKAGDGLPRGHSLLNGALDMSLALTKDGDGIVVGRMSKNRNGPSDVTLAFCIGTRRLGTDEDGDPITTAICEEMKTADVPRKSDKLPPATSAAYVILRQLSHDGKPVAEAAWLEACVSGRAVSQSEVERNRRDVFRRAARDLMHRKLIDFRDGNYLPMITSPVKLADYTDDFPDEGGDE